MYQKRICFRIGRFNYYGRFRGKAPIEKAFTLEQFMNSFYVVKDKDGMYFYVLMSDRQFFKYRTQKENGEVVLRIKRLEFNEEIICSKKRGI
jgi:hypothetical protein